MADSSATNVFRSGIQCEEAILDWLETDDVVTRIRLVASNELALDECCIRLALCLVAHQAQTKLEAQLAGAIVSASGGYYFKRFAKEVGGDQALLLRLKHTFDELSRHLDATDRRASGLATGFFIEQIINHAKIRIEGEFGSKDDFQKALTHSVHALENRFAHIIADCFNLI